MAIIKFHGNNNFFADISQNIPENLNKKVLTLSYHKGTFSLEAKANSSLTGESVENFSHAVEHFFKITDKKLRQKKNFQNSPKELEDLLKATKKIETAALEFYKKTRHINKREKNEPLDIIPLNDLQERFRETEIKISQATYHLFDITIKPDYTESLLVQAFKQMKRELALQLMDKGLDINSRDKDGTPLLMLACRNKWEDVALKLIEKGADIHAKNKYETTALHSACYYGLEKVFSKLVELGADIHAKTTDGFTPLLSACGEGQDELVQELLLKGASVESGQRKGDNPLLLSFCKKDPIPLDEETLLLLIEKGANIDETTKLGSCLRKGILR